MDFVSLVVGFVVGGVSVLVMAKMATSYFVVACKYKPPAKGGAVVITGASRGIGKACAFDLANKGFRVYAGVRKTADGDALVAAASAEGVTSGNVVPILLDVTDQTQVDTAVETVAAKEAGGVVALVNNAGINVGPIPVEFLEPSLLSRQLDVNVVGQLRVTRAFLPLLRKQKGRVVFMSSVAGSIGNSFGGPYTTSKFALEGLADCLRRELVPWKMSVSVIKPAELQTELLGRYQEDGRRAYEALPEAGKRFYGQFYENLKPTRSKYVGKLSLVTEAVSHAVSHPAPKTRYLVATKAMMASHLRPFAKMGISLPVWSAVPDRFLDKQMRRNWPKRYNVPQE